MRREAGLLTLIHSETDLPLPKIEVFEAPQLFSRHEKIPGTALSSEHYDRLDQWQRHALADQLAHFYVSLHQVPRSRATTYGAIEVGRWPSVEDILDRAAGKLPQGLHQYAKRTAEYYEAFASEDIMVFGQFDTHGRNMAFDHGLNRLNGIFDFGDAGIGPLHLDLSYPCFISPELTFRVVVTYQEGSSIEINLERVFACHGMLRLLEVATTENSEPFVTLFRSWWETPSAHRL